MVHKGGLRTVIVGALMTVGCVAIAHAAPIAPAAALTAPVKLVSWWGRAFPYGYAYYSGQCYTYVQEETPTGYVWRRVWICNEKHGQPQFGHGYSARF